MMFTLLPIVMLLIIVAIVVAIILKGKKIVTIKFTYWLLLVYTAILVVSTTAAALVLGDSEHINETSKENIRDNRITLEKQLSSGRIDEINSQHLLKHSSFDYHQPTLKLMMNGPAMHRIFIEKKAEDDGAIDAYAYTSGLSINGIDFTDRITPPVFRLMNDTFAIETLAHENEINLSMIKKEFTITQFTGEGSSFFDPIEHHDPIIYLRIPNSLTITEENGYYSEIKYINES